MHKLRVLPFSPAQRLTKNYQLLLRFQDALPEQNLSKSVKDVKTARLV